MPTTKPRINVTLSPALEILVSRLAKVEQISKSMAIREVLEAAKPSLEEALVLMEAAFGAGFEARRRIAADMQKGLQASQKAQELALDLMITNESGLSEKEKKVDSRRASRPQGRRAVAGVGKLDK